MSDLCPPAGWSLKTLGELVQVVSGSTPSRENIHYWQGGTIPWATPTDITGNRSRTLTSTAEKITPRGLASCAVQLLPVGSLLMTSRATLGEIKVAGTEVCTNQGFKSLVPRSLIDGWYLFYQMQMNKERYSLLGKGSTFLEVNKWDTESFEILYAPLVEQRKIARILTTVDNLIEKTEALIAKYQAIKQGMMHDLFTRGVDEHGHLRPPYKEAPELYKQSELGWIPREWEVCLLDEVAHRGSGHTPNKLIGAYWNGGIKWVSLADSDKLDRLFITDTDKNISELGLANSSAIRHRAGTVILSRDAGIGKSAIISDIMAVSQHFMAWFCGPRLINYFLYYWLQHEKPRFEAIAMGSTIKTIGLSFFKKLRIAVPPMPEQRIGSDAVLSVERRLFGLAEELAKYRVQKTGLMQDLLTGKVRVKADESEEVAARA